MPDPTLITLAERVEAASGPDRELDALISMAVRAFPEGVDPAQACNMRPLVGEAGQLVYWEAVEPYLGTLRAKNWEPVAYTASIDAAMSLMPKGFAWAYHPTKHVPHNARVMRPETGGFVGHSDHSAALALVAAALRARAALQSLSLEE